MSKLTVKQINALPRKVSFETGFGNWFGKSTGEIKDGLYLEVYSAYSINTNSKRKNSYKSCLPINIPISRVYSF